MKEAAIFDLLNKWLDCLASRCVKSLDMLGVMLYNTLRGAPVSAVMCVVFVFSWFVALCEFLCNSVQAVFKVL